MNANLLTATITVPGLAPDAVRAPQAHKRYFKDPNNEEWGPWLGASCSTRRSTSGSCSPPDTLRTLRETSGDVSHTSRRPARSSRLRRRLKPSRAARWVGRFRPSIFLQCWARYWDVHTRGAYRIIEEEDISGPDVPAVLAERGPGGFGYTARQFDLVMKRGDDCEQYARPYLWMLERAHGNTRFVAYTFPIICFHAFRCAEPVGLFLECFERAQKYPAVHHVLAHSDGNINVDWFSVAAKVEAPILKPALASRGVTGGGIGMGAIIDGKSPSNHPLLPNYVNWFNDLAKFIAESVPKLSTRRTRRLCRPRNRSGRPPCRHHAGVHFQISWSAQRAGNPWSLLTADVHPVR